MVMTQMPAHSIPEWAGIRKTRQQMLKVKKAALYRYCTVSESGLRGPCVAKQALRFGLHIPNPAASALLHFPAGQIPWPPLPVEKVEPAAFPHPAALRPASCAWPRWRRLPHQNPAFRQGRRTHCFCQKRRSARWARRSGRASPRRSWPALRRLHHINLLFLQIFGRRRQAPASKNRI